MKKGTNIIGVIGGIVSIIFSFVVKGMPIGLYEFSETYGGDAYTGIQNAAAQTAVNIYYLADIVRTGLFAFLLVFGIALICFFLSRINIDVKLIVKKEDKCEKKEASAASVALPATAPDDTVTVVEQNETEAVEHN